VGVRIKSEKVSHIESIGQVVGGRRRLPLWMNGWTRVWVEGGAGLTKGVENLERDPFANQVGDESIAFQVPTFPFYLDKGERVVDEKLPRTSLSVLDSNKITRFEELKPEGALKGPMREFARNGLIVWGEIAGCGQRG
jgi:hypothetical protein